MSHRNKFEAWCLYCRRPVPAGCGYLLPKSPDCGWQVACAGCFFGTYPYEPPRYTPPAPIFTPPCLRVLGLMPPVDRLAIKKKFRELALASHPDRGGDARSFIEIEHAYREALVIAGGRS